MNREYMKNKLKVLWFAVIPLGWWLSFILVKWVQFYPIDCLTNDSPIGLCLFLVMSGLIGTVAIFTSSIALAIYMQD